MKDCYGKYTPKDVQPRNCADCDMLSLCISRGNNNLPLECQIEPERRGAVQMLVRIQKLEKMLKSAVHMLEGLNNEFVRDNIEEGEVSYIIVEATALLGEDYRMS